MLLAGLSPAPAPEVVLKMLVHSPVELVLGQLLRDPRRLRNAMAPHFLSKNLPPGERAAHLERLDLESPVAMSELFARGPVVRRADDARPALVVAATDDVSIPLRSHEQASERLGAALVRVPGAHDLMLDPRWREGAERVDALAAREFRLGGAQAVSCLGPRGAAP